MAKTDSKIVYYGPHPCQKCDPEGTKGTMIVKAGNGASDKMEYDYPKVGIAYPNYKWPKHKHLA